MLGWLQHMPRTGICWAQHLSTRLMATLKRVIEEQDALARILRCCGETKNLAEGEKLHARIRNGEHGENRYLANLLVQMYGKCGSLVEARGVFDGISSKNFFSWSIMMTAYAQNGYLEQAKAIFYIMPNRDVVSWTGIVQGYALNGYLEEAQSVFARMPHWDVVSWNAILTAYGQDGHLGRAKDMFDNMPERSLATWNAIVTVYSQNGHLQNAKNVFDRMPEWNVVSWSSLVQAYAQNGHLGATKSMFDRMPERNVISWTAMLAAYAQNGHGKDTIELFGLMNIEGVKPDEVSFLSVLLGCSHMGIVDGSRQYFMCMMVDFGLKPTNEHYCCMVDMLGRAGRLQDAENLINSMPYLPNEVAWGSLLGACRIYRDAERAARAAEGLIELDPKNDALYALLGNTYAALGRQADVLIVKKMMVDRGVRKIPGVSIVD